MMLFFDIGNTRAKWHLQLEGVSRYGAAPLKAASSHQSPGEALDGLRSEMLSLVENHNEAPTIVVSSVAGEKVESLFNLWFQRLGVQATYVHVRRKFAGIEVGYNDESRLGVDRWLALVAAHNARPGYNVVLDAGSALTIDFVDPNGLHEGGVIVPGGRVIGAALGEGASGLGDFNRSESLTLPQNWAPACDTVEGIRNGVAAMYAGLVVEALSYYKDKAAQHDAPCRVWVTGGDGKALLPYCARSLDDHLIEFREHLVLDGLSIWHQQQA